MKYFAGNYDVAVIGAGHAGIEAALASARLGANTVIFTVNLDWIGNMACNPSIGGTSKGHLVREIDALGGEMGKAADKTLIQSRILNLGKGPAVHSLRAQIDRRDYTEYMKRCLENQENLDIKQAEIIDIEIEDGKVCAVITATGARVQSIVIENDGEYRTVEGIGTEVDYKTLTKEEILAKIKDAGIVGLGGAGFPTHVKLAPKNADAIEYIIANGAECEPYITCDDQLMRGRADEIVTGMEIMLSLFPNAEGVVIIEENKLKAYNEDIRRWNELHSAQ